MMQALIFDFDGLILDTEVPDLQSWQEVYAAHGCDFPMGLWARNVGTAGDPFDAYAHLEAHLGRPVDRDAIRARRHRRFAELVEAQAVMPGITDYLAEARRLGLKLGVASSSSRDWVTGHLARLGLAGSFDSIKSANDVQRAKPDPALYHAVLDALGLAPERAIAFEDSPNGIVAAKRAGVFGVAVPNAVTRQLEFDGADLRLDSLAEMPLQQLLEVIEVRRATGRPEGSPGGADGHGRVDHL
jgi:HAD superfamily hydrolase (TIGR01509 family)